jgi:hypothetical protein
MPSVRGGHQVATTDRRAVLRGAGAAGLGIVASTLPSATAAASGDIDTAAALSPTTVTALPAGYGDDGTTGALEISWTPVVGASTYTVHLRTGEDPFSLGSTPLSGTSTKVSGLTADAEYEVYVVAAASDPGTDSSQSLTVTANSSIGVGGSIGTFTDGGVTYAVHAFTTSGTGPQTSHTFALRRARDVDHLIVAGGGGGGGDVGGGGGAGGLLTTLTTARGTGSGPIERPVGTSTLLVGHGGAGGVQSPDVIGIGADGAASSAFTLTAVGGGGGGTWGGGDAGTEPGRAGGSGGGGGGYSLVSSKAGGAGTVGQGSDGGAGWQGQFAGGSGGGAGATGVDGSDSSPGAAGGAGLVVAIVPTELATALGIGDVGGTSLYFAGGGGAGSHRGDGAGGLGGGGLGRARGGSLASVDGTAATGGGGGGHGGVSSGEVKGGDGGSGVIVLRYPLP